VTYVVTAGAAFLGRHLVGRLLRRREGRIAVLVQQESLPRLDRLNRWSWQSSERIEPVLADFTAPCLGVDAAWMEERTGAVDDFFHLMVGYDVTASPEDNERLNVEGTRQAVLLATALGAGTFHHVSSVAVAGDRRGVFDETMFDEGQPLATPYHRTLFEAERIVRQECSVPWRIYRTSLVVGHSETGEMDRVDGLYYLFAALKRLRDNVPTWAPLLSVDLGDTNVVPVDYVAGAMDHLASVDGLAGETFHLINPEPQTTVDVVNTMAAAAGAARFAVPIDRDVTAALPPALAPVHVLTSVLRSTAAQRVLEQTIGRLGIPPAVVDQLVLPATVVAGRTERALAGSGIVCPPLEGYAGALWDYWEQHLDPAPARDVALRQALQGRSVLVLGANSRIAKAVALRVAQAGAVPLLVDRDEAGLLAIQFEVEEIGGTSHPFPCDLADLDAVDALAQSVATGHETVDVIVNSAGCNGDHAVGPETFSDFEEALQRSYFGPARLLHRLLPTGVSGAAHVICVCCAEPSGTSPAFSAYLIGTAIRNAWSRVASSRAFGDGVRLTTVDVPSVRTPRAASTSEDETGTVTPAQAANLVMEAVKSAPQDRPRPVAAAGAGAGAGSS
jgi:thioester reductase-like protein/NAD(P)-dependent dehydrogenase (short-subunit alcohol dehydrogenase family)